MPAAVYGALAVPLSAQDSRPIPEPKRAQAVRLPGGSVALDGRLDDEAWRRVPFVTDFRTKNPVEFGEPGDQTAVAFAYDDAAFYVAARMSSADPARIPRDVTRRDQSGNAEELVISLDPFLDRRTAFSFSVSAGGARSDYFHPEDEDDERDYTFDPVWEARVQVDSAGWTAEMRIPFSQLRFAPRPVQEWGLNIARYVPQRNEDVYWVVVPRRETGFASRFGTLTGIEGIEPARRIELLPYVAGNGTIAARPDPANPFEDRTSGAARAGLDAKLGLGPNLTLDVTVNPDFGQVEADPAEVNLTAFETFFDERRPFFTEGSQLLRGPVDNYFYSRRIGGRPRGRVSGAADYVDTPENTTILGAAKVTGRITPALSIGALAAVTDRERARTFNAATGGFDRQEVEPRSAFGVLRLQQQFGEHGSTVGGTVAGMERFLPTGSPLATQLTNRAVSGGLDWELRFAGGAYVVSGSLGGSYLQGDSLAVRRIQESSGHFFQRPDFQAFKLDPRRTSLAGLKGDIRFTKQSGRLLGSIGVTTESPGFETNDAGRLQNADDINAELELEYRQTDPGRVFRSWEVGADITADWNYDGVRTGGGLTLGARVTWANYLSTDLDLTLRPRALSDVLTRGGPLMGTGRSWSVEGSMETNDSRPTRLDVSASVSGDELGGSSFSFGPELSFRPSSALAVSFEPEYEREVEVHQFVGREDGGTAATFGSRYIFARVTQRTISAQLRVSYTFSPDLTLEAYAEPFAASGRFSDYGELTAARSRSLRAYGTDGTTITRVDQETFQVDDTRNGQSFTLDDEDFQELSFRSNLVLRWEWRRGSTLFLVWQQDRSRSCTPGSPEDCTTGVTPGRTVSGRSLWNAVRAPGDNFVAIKISYWLPAG